jgi:nucleoside-diphosphate-sugar epimerase
MEDLLIGNTSQVSKYFSDKIFKVSSRDIDASVFLKKWNRVFLCFAEQRTFKKFDELFNQVNFLYTKEILDNLKANQIYYYSSAELWNNSVGGISVDMPFNYHVSDYMESKKNISNYIKSTYNNVIILYPFNFNSKHRMPPFLFGKVISSIVNKEKITLGDTYYYRELLHPSFVVEETITATKDKIIGSGQLIFINDFIRELYEYFDLNYNEYVIEDIKEPSIYRKNIFYNSERKNYGKGDVFKEMVKEIKEKINENRN